MAPVRLCEFHGSRYRAVILESRETLALELTEFEAIGSSYEFGACEQPVEYRSRPAYLRNGPPNRDAAFDVCKNALPIREVDGADDALNAQPFDIYEEAEAESGRASPRAWNAWAAASR